MFHHRAPFLLLAIGLIGCGRSTDCGIDGKWAALTLAHLQRYPAMEPVDAFKLLQQATLGSEHAVRDSLEPARWMTREWAALGEGPVEPLVDTLGASGGFARVHLRPWRATGRAPSEIVAAFVATARTAVADTGALRCAIQGVVALARGAKVPWNPDSIVAQGKQWEKARFPAVEHSPGFERRYRPAYRVVALPLLHGLLTPTKRGS